MQLVNQLTGFGGRPPATFPATEVSRTAETTGSGLTVTISTGSIGAIADNRYIVVTASGEISGDVDPSFTATLDDGEGGGPVAMTVHREDFISPVADNTNFSAVFGLAVPAPATTATVVVTSTHSTSGFACEVHRVTNVTTPLHDADGDAGTGSAARAGTVNVAAGGCCIAVSCHAGLQSCTWTNLTEDLDTNSGTHDFSTAHDAAMALEIARVITATWTSSDRISTSVCSFR